MGHQREKSKPDLGGTNKVVDSLEEGIPQRGSPMIFIYSIRRGGYERRREGKRYA
jgi:hypothetical protein